ncbi:MAG: DUF3592 domain-containing protein [Actinomycetota bacterium]
MLKALQGWGKIGAIAGIAGGVIGAVAAIGAVLAAGLASGQAWWLVAIETGATVLFCVVFFGIFYFVFRWAFRSVNLANDLAERGEAAEATVLEVHETGVTVNEVYPMIGVTLEVRRTGRPAYQVKTQWLIDRLQIPQFQPGAVIPVMVDPENPDNVAFGVPAPSGAAGTEKKVGWGVTPGGAAAPGPAGKPGPPEQQAEQMLRKNDEMMEAILASGTSADATVVSATSLDIFVNGNNPAMKFVLEVHPEGGPKFRAETIGVIAEASVPKYKAGENIRVRYDPGDLTKVAIEHS